MSVCGVGTTHQAILTLGRECRECCNGSAELIVLQLINEYVSEEVSHIQSSVIVVEVTPTSTNLQLSQNF